MVISLMGPFQQKSAWSVATAADQEDLPTELSGTGLCYGPILPCVRPWF